jgi:hypothetical protein
MLRISIKTYGKSPKTLKADLEKFRSKLEAEIPALGKEVHTFMTSFINANRKRPGGTGNLANSITFEADKTGFAIGDINVLNEKAPYWEVINYGGVIPPKTFGYFFPGEPRPHPSYFRQGRWHEAGRDYGMEENYGFPMTPKKAIKTMDYIERTNHFLRLSLAQLLRKVRIK